MFNFFLLHLVNKYYNNYFEFICINIVQLKTDLYKNAYIGQSKITFLSKFTMLQSASILTHRDKLQRCYRIITIT